MTNRTKFNSSGWIALVLSVLLASEVLAQRSEMLFRFRDGSTLVGSLEGTTNSSAVAVNSALFNSPLVVPLDQLLEARTMETATNGEPIGESLTPVPKFAFFLNDGCVLIGTPENHDDSRLRFRTSQFGLITVDASHVQKIIRVDLMPELLCSMADSLFRIRREEGWRIESGMLVGQQPGAAAVANFELPVRFRLRLRVACQGDPDFELTLGDRSKDGAGQGGRVDRRGSSLARLPSERFVTAVEWFGKDVSLVRANFSVAQAAVFESTGLNNTIDLELFVDQNRGQLLVYQDGLLAGQAAVQDADPVLRQVLTLINRGDEVTVERLQLFRWDGTPPESRRLPDRFVELDDGTVIEGAVDEVEMNRFRVGQTWYPLSELARIQLTDSTDRAEQGRRCGVVLNDGTRIHGRLLKTDQSISMSNTAGDLSFHLPTTEVVRLIGHATELVSEQEAVATLRSGKTVLSGRLTESDQVEIPLAWHTSMMASPLKIQVERDAEIRFGGESDDFGQSDVSAQGPESEADFLPTIRLYNGDVVSASLVSLEAGRAMIRGETFGQASLPAESIQRVDLNAFRQVASRDLEMLMQLPRRQQDSPPTHLLVSVTGDLLRGKLIEVDPHNLRIEVRGVKRLLPRHRIGRIEFLSPSGDEPSLPRYEVETLSGSRLSVNELLVDGSMLRCQHSLLGECRFDLEDLRRIEFGPTVGKVNLVPKFVPVQEPKTFE